MQQASRALLLFVGLIVLVHVIQGYKAGQGLSQAKRWIAYTFTGRDLAAPAGH